LFLHCPNILYYSKGKPACKRSIKAKNRSSGQIATKWHFGAGFVFL
jgi:hypothetical protein